MYIHVFSNTNIFRNKCLFKSLWKLRSSNFKNAKKTIERKNLYKDKLTSSLNENLGAYIKTMIPRFRNRENKICCLGRVVRFVDFNSSFCLSSCWLPGL